jgi:hypothetical protein
MSGFSADEVAALIARLEQRAADGELFAQLALPGWRKELQSLLKGGDDLAPETTDDGLATASQGVSRT